MTLKWLKAPKRIDLQGFILFVLVVFTFSSSLYAQDANIDLELVKKGKELYKGNCASCHNPLKDMTGPKLEGVTAKWEAQAAGFQGKSGKEWLYEWIKNWNTPVEAGLPYAVEMQNFSPAAMQLNLGLSDADIEAMLYYADHSTALDVKVTTDVAVVEEDTTPYVNWLLGFLVVSLAIAAFALHKVNKSLVSAAAQKSGIAQASAVPFFKSGFFKTVVTTLLVAIVLYLLASQAIALGRQQGYQPVQPIKYSHALHAGEFEIDCKYCHTAAVEGKHSNIPSTNVCMNCHKMIQSGPKHGRKEIAKIYAAIGYNPIQGSYFDLKNTKEAQYKKVFKEFLALDKDNKNVTPATDEDLEAVLKMFNKPVEWVRIHNLPDHVYFNHAQHVNVGKVECQTCHGNIQEMEVVAQHAPLSMGWCINCHRNTEVDLGNGYYKDFDKFHEMKEKHKSFTVEDIGGTECQKCHY